nr:uncharacterized protein LOC112428093 [Macaca nemestrina]
MATPQPPWAGGSVPLREPEPPGEREEGGPRGTTGWARGPRRGLRGRGQGKRERQRQAGGEGGGAGLFLNSASTRSLALWFLRVVYSIFLFLRRPSPLRVRAETRGLVGSGSARGSLAGVGPRGHPRAGGGWTGGPRWRSGRGAGPEVLTRPDTFLIRVLSYLKSQMSFFFIGKRKLTT